MANVTINDLSFDTPTDNAQLVFNEGGVDRKVKKSDLVPTGTGPSEIPLNSNLGTAATKDVGTNSGNVMEVGAFGLGKGNNLRNTIYTTGTPADLYGKGYVVGFTDGSMLTPSIGGSNNYGTLEVKFTYNDGTGITSYSREFTTNDRVYVQKAVDGNTWGPWRELISTGSILTTTGQSTQYPMTQKAVTDALDTKANTSSLGSAATVEVATFDGAPQPPTTNGSIIESGSNANGTYIKYADGTAFWWADIEYTGLSVFGGGQWSVPVPTRPLTMLGSVSDGFVVGGLSPTSGVNSLYAYLAYTPLLSYRYVLVNSGRATSSNLAFPVTGTSTMDKVKVKYSEVGRWRA